MSINSEQPAFRKLRGYAFDPSLSLKLDTVAINSVTYKVPWESLEPGPVGEYLEIVDYDPTVKKFYAPVNLDDPYLLAEQGLSPSESNPKFHQQMVYAVAMTTIKNFEKALGRKVLWSRRVLADDVSREKEYVKQLRIYPHALREPNAYYSPLKKAVLFGYFSATPASNTLHMPGALVFNCLSHDIIAHEVTHAILDGMHYYYNEATNPDVLAFHEAFADIVALFQHFTFPEVLKHQIAQTRGDLQNQNLLGKLAQEYGSAVGSYNSLRDAIGEIDPITKEWRPKEPNPNDYRNKMEPHERGSILVAAVFEAFVKIYKRRVADILRIATNGSGILPQGDLHPDLVNRLAKEASKAAEHVLNMCIRALDYCPPVDITFGDYLRAIITADVDLITDDNKDYRLAFIDVFRRRGIYPENIKTLSISSLKYDKVKISENSNGTKYLLDTLTAFLKEYRNQVMYIKDREKIFNITRDFIIGKNEKGELIGENKEGGLHKRISFKFESEPYDFEEITGLIFNNDWEKFGVRTSKSYHDAPGPSIQVVNLRLVTRVGPDGNQVNQIIFSLLQRCGVVLKDGDFYANYIPDEKNDYEKDAANELLELRGGCTLIFDLDNVKLEYSITKPLLDVEKLQSKERVINKYRINKQYNYQIVQAPLYMSEYANLFGIKMNSYINEPFAFLHTH